MKGGEPLVYYALGATDRLRGVSIVSTNNEMRWKCIGRSLPSHTEISSRAWRDNRLYAVLSSGDCIFPQAKTNHVGHIKSTSTTALSM